MLNKVELHGPSADVRWGYLSAATLGQWTLTARPDGGTLTATIERMDAFRIGQAQLTFQVNRPGQAWVWPIRSLSIADQTLTASLGPQE